MRPNRPPFWRSLAVVFCVAACASPTGTAGPTIPGLGSGLIASSAATVAPATAQPTSPASPLAATDAPSEAPTPAPTEAAATEAPTDAPATQEPTVAPATPSGPSAPAASVAAGVKVLSVETIDERTRDLMIETPSLAQPVGVRLLLPKDFDADPSRRWPVLYLLHGAGGDADSYHAWAYSTDVQTLVASTNLLVVMPQGDGFGWYSDWWNGGNGGPPMWETFHLTELRAILERDWRAGDQRAIAGLSMGGYGAFVYAARNPGLFKAAASFSGPLDILGEKDSGLLGNEPGVWGDPADQVDIWKAHNPIDLAESLRGTALYVSYGDGGQGPLDPSDPGDDGEAFRSIGNKAFVAKLAELDIPVTVDAYGPGSHTWPYFERALHRSLPMILKALGEPA